MWVLVLLLEVSAVLAGATGKAMEVHTFLDPKKFVGAFIVEHMLVLDMLPFRQLAHCKPLVPWTPLHEGLRGQSLCVFVLTSSCFLIISLWAT